MKRIVIFFIAYLLLLSGYFFGQNTEKETREVTSLVQLLEEK